MNLDEAVARAVQRDARKQEKSNEVIRTEILMVLQRKLDLAEYEALKARLTPRGDQWAIEWLGKTFLVYKGPHGVWVREDGRYVFNGQMHVIEKGQDLLLFLSWQKADPEWVSRSAHDR